MADVQIPAPGVSNAPLEYTVPQSLEIVLKTLYAEFDGSGASGSFYPTIEIVSPAGQRVGLYRTQDSVSAGDSAHVTWGPFLGIEVVPDLFPRNMGELGMSGSGTQSDIYTHTIQFQDVQPGDGVFVSAQAPSKPSALGAVGLPTQCYDSKGNTYAPVDTFYWEAGPPNVNEGAVQSWFFLQATATALVAGVDTITVEWSNPVFDRSIDAWLVRHDGGAVTPVELAASPDRSAAIFASNQVTLTSPAFTPTRDNGLAFGTIFAAKAGGVGGFGGVAGYSGYLEVQSRGFTGSKQTYTIHQETFGANAIVINPFGAPKYEIDLGQLPANVAVGAFNGVAQFYTAGANAWKGITIWEID